MYIYVSPSPPMTHRFISRPTVMLVFRLLTILMSVTGVTIQQMSGSEMLTTRLGGDVKETDKGH